MDSQTLFYICGIVLAVSAVATTFAGLKLEGFPGRALPVVILWFVVFVGAATTFAVLQAQDEEAAKAAELEHAGEEVEATEEGEETAEGPAEEEPVGGAEGAATTLKLAADPAAIAFDTTELSAKPGKVTIEFENPSAIPHDVVIEEDGKELAGTPEITESTASVSADLKAGTYTFLCTVPGHAQAGMEGTLTVK